MKKIPIRTKEITFFIGAEDILYCKAAGAYSVIYLLDKKEIVTSVNLLNLFENTDPFSKEKAKESYQSTRLLQNIKLNN